MKPPKADLHTHSYLKPYGHSYYTNNNKKDASSGASPWMQDKDTNLDDLLENSAGFGPYRQADLKSCVEGNYKFIINSFYAIEQGFLAAKSDVVDTVAGKTFANILTEFGKEWISKIKSGNYNYYDDVIKQMNFALELNNDLPANGISKYRVLESGMDIEQEVMKGDLMIINSIEGAQALCNGNDPGEISQWIGIEARVAELKSHICRPFFITFAHHFYNGLCSHCESLFELEKLIKGQGLGMNTLKARTWKGNDYKHLSDTEISELGYRVIELLLSTANGPAILIDVKHMSELARKEFYEYRRARHPGLPIIYSHGACQKFYSYEINLSENDIREIAISNGIMGLELDQRIIGYNQSLPKLRIGRWLGNIFRGDRKQNILWAKPFWDNLQYIAETCYDAGLTEDPWKCICIGSDYDGIINPLNEFRTIDKIDDLLNSLEDYLKDYWENENPKIPLNTGGETSDVMYKIGYKNLLEFVGTHFK